MWTLYRKEFAQKAEWGSPREWGLAVHRAPPAPLAHWLLTAPLCVGLPHGSPHSLNLRVSQCKTVVHGGWIGGYFSTFFQSLYYPYIIPKGFLSLIFFCQCLRMS